jgi:hypothetical protein
MEWCLLVSGRAIFAACALVRAAAVGPAGRAVGPLSIVEVISGHEKVKQLHSDSCHCLRGGVR